MILIAVHVQHATLLQPPQPAGELAAIAHEIVRDHLVDRKEHDQLRARQWRRAGCLRGQRRQTSREQCHCAGSSEAAQRGVQRVQ